MKYKVGDKVRVLSDLVKDDPRFRDVGVEEEMEAFRGKKVTISHLYKTGEYLISEDGEEYLWAEDMFSEITEFELDDLETRMVVETRDKCRYLVLRGRYLVLRDKEKIHFMNANGNTCIRNSQGFGPLYDENMKNGNPDKDILKVFPKVDTFEEVKTVNDPIWERKEPKKMTLTEICNELGYDIEIIPECEAVNEE
ncbi:hypothetical protein [uncultured Robinsoniella sp.]|uniref:hypothetical protein n=1 Tax=uncultured Robinsoniella sp. TaxID=904190 RepID=UPI00374F8CE7